AGRDRLRDAYRVGRRTLDEVTEQLTAAEAEARRERAAAPPVAFEELPAGEQPAEEPPVEETRAIEETHAAGAAPPDAGDDDRRSSSVRIVRELAVEIAPATEPEAAEPEPPPVETAHEPAAVELEPDEAERFTPEEPPAPDQAAPPAGDVEALFARLRADREEAVAEAEEVLAAVERDEEPAPEDLVASATSAVDAAEPVAA